MRSLRWRYTVREAYKALFSRHEDLVVTRSSPLAEHDPARSTTARQPWPDYPSGGRPGGGRVGFNGRDRSRTSVASASNSGSLCTRVAWDSFATAAMSASATERRCVALSLA